MLWIGLKNRLKFRFWPKNQSQFWWSPFFFFRDYLFLGRKNVWISDFGRIISLKFGEELFFFFFFFFWRSPGFGLKKTFEFLSFPRNSVSIFGHTVWFCFKNNENSGKGRLHFSHSFKKSHPPPPPFSKSWLRAWLFYQTQKKQHVNKKKEIKSKSRLSSVVSLYSKKFIFLPNLKIEKIKIGFLVWLGKNINILRK